MAVEHIGAHEKALRDALRDAPKAKKIKKISKPKRKKK